MSTPDPLPIRDDMIRLGQALKLGSLVEDGAQARDLIAEGQVSVNGQVVTERGRQLHRGDVIRLGDQALEITGQD